MDKETNHTEPAEEMPFTEYEYVKLGSITMMCSNHNQEMIFIDDSNAVCPSCFAHEMDCSLEESIAFINQEKQELKQIREQWAKDAEEEYENMIADKAHMSKHER
tara:strand:+ start:1199 stop:1513 length:315 start_codon:yes stop_codon:yes gene_type:complete